MKEQIIAYEWHNADTGHCYVDYIAHNLMDENNGYIKTPLYKREEILHIIEHDFCKIIDEEVGRKVAEVEKRMPTEEEIDNASKDLKIEEKGLELPNEIKEMHEELLRIGFVIGAKYFRNRMKGGEK